MSCLRYTGKQGTYNPETNGGRYPFKITLNELGEDLVSGSDTITLVDDRSDTLILDTTSIQVVNTKTGDSDLCQFRLHSYRYRFRQQSPDRNHRLLPD